MGMKLELLKIKQLHVLAHCRVTIGSVTSYFKKVKERISNVFTTKK